MDQVIEFFSKLFHTTDWPPRWMCGRWTEFHGWLYICSDIVIWLAYFIIPVILIYFIQQRPKIPFLPVFWLFGAFIILCGATHLIDAVIFWWPGYRLSALLRFFTAVVSIFTAFALIRDLPKLLDFTNFTTKPNESTEVRSLKEELSAREREIRVLEERMKSYQEPSA